MISFHENHIPEEFGPKLPTEEEVISMMKNQGQFSPETMDTFAIWFLNKQKERDESENIYSEIIFNIDMANFYLKAGFVDSAKEYCNKAWSFINDQIIERGVKLEDDFLDVHRDLLEISDKIDKKLF